MPGISVKIPLQEDFSDGKYSLNKTIEDSIKQNLKNLLLTAPGERIGDPDFGVGLRNFLFNIKDESVSFQISSRIHQQLSKYMPFVEIKDDYYSEMDGDTVFVRIYYFITPLEKEDIIDLSINLT
jgi:phage baseplate assembly protein W